MPISSSLAPVKQEIKIAFLFDDRMRRKEINHQV